MTENTSPHPTVLDSAESSPSASLGAADTASCLELEPDAFSVDSYATHLMDELFEDVERMLHQAGSLPIEADEPEYVTLESITVSPLALAPILAPRLSTLEVEEADVNLDELAAEAIREVDEQSRPSGNGFDGLLLVAAFAAIAATGAVWFALQQRVQLPGAAVAPAPTAEQAATDPDAAFLSYMQRSLERLDRSLEANRQSGAIASAPPNAPATTANAPQAPTQTVLERVYIPVYQPPQIFNQFPSGVQPPAVATAPAAPSVTAPAPAPVAEAPAPTAPAPVAPAPAPAATATNIAPANADHVLIGVLELGDRSAALFEINGVPRRVQLGESIGSSGATLVLVRDQEAIIRRNGEVRSIYIGQQF